MERHIIRYHIVMLVTLVGLATAACGGSSGGGTPQGSEDAGRETVDEGDPVYGGSLVVGVNAETNGWTPQTNQWAEAGTFVAASVVEPLAIFDDNGLAIPYLAESWEADATLENWTVTLRNGTRFHDGEPLDAEAAKTNLDQAVASPLIGIAMGRMIDNVEVLDELTFVIHLTRPWAHVPAGVLALQSGVMVSPKMFDEPDLGTRHPVGTGPFVFEEWTPDGSFVATRNDDYWRTADNGDELPYLDQIEFRVIVDDSARASALDTGEIDMMLTLHAPSIVNYLATDQDRVTLIQDNQRAETFIQLNEAKPPFDNEHARRATAMAVDPAAVTATLGEGVTQPVDQFFSADEPYHADDAGYVAYDPQGAERALQLYLDETGAESLSFTVQGPASVDDTALLQLLQQQWAEVGIDVSIDVVEQTTFILDSATGNFEAGYFRNFGSTDPDFIYGFLHSDFAGQDEGDIRINFTGTKLDELDQLLDQQRSATEPEQRAQTWQDLVRVVNQELPYIWLFNTPYALVASPDVKGLNPARELGFGNFEIKWWISELWREP
jgi:peptide/nickel transport system substrate-binding protein